MTRWSHSRLLLAALASGGSGGRRGGARRPRAAPATQGAATTRTLGGREPPPARSGRQRGAAPRACRCRRATPGLAPGVRRRFHRLAPRPGQWRTYWGQPGGDPGGWFDPTTCRLPAAISCSPATAIRPTADAGRPRACRAALGLVPDLRQVSRPLPLRPRVGHRPRHPAVAGGQLLAAGDRLQRGQRRQSPDRLRDPALGPATRRSRAASPWI